LTGGVGGLTLLIPPRETPAQLARPSIDLIAGRTPGPRYLRGGASFACADAGCRLPCAPRKCRAFLARAGV